MPDQDPGNHQALDLHRQDAERLLKALANEHRLNILCCLRQGEISVSELSRCLPLSQSALSQHLAWLRAEHLVHTRRCAQNVYYQLSDDKADRIIRVLNSLYCQSSVDENSYAATQNVGDHQ